MDQKYEEMLKKVLKESVEIYLKKIQDHCTVKKERLPFDDAFEERLADLAKNE